MPSGVRIPPPGQMTQLYFITGNKGKLTEAQSIIPSVLQKDIDLPEIQEIDAKKIIEYKLHEAMDHIKEPCIVEDTSLYINSLNGLPGPLIKWFLKTIGTEGIFSLVASLEDKSAVARTIIGYADKSGSIQFFEGEIKGTIVKPRGDKGFGWDSIFQPAESTKTFAEMTLEEKMKFSMRKVAAEKLKKYIEGK